MFPVAHVLKLFEGSFKAFQKEQRKAARSILAGVLAVLFWMATATVGMSQTNSVSEACSVVIILTLAFVSFTILCLERLQHFCSMVSMQVIPNKRSVVPFQNEWLDG